MPSDAILADGDAVGVVVINEITGEGIHILAAKIGVPEAQDRGDRAGEVHGPDRFAQSLPTPFWLRVHQQSVTTTIGAGHLDAAFFRVGVPGRAQTAGLEVLRDGLTWLAGTARVGGDCSQHRATVRGACGQIDEAAVDVLRILGQDGTVIARAVVTLVFDGRVENDLNGVGSGRGAHAADGDRVGRGRGWASGLDHGVLAHTQSAGAD